MVFSTENKMLIKNLVLLKGFSSHRVLHEFPQKCWNKNGLDVLLRRRPRLISVWAVFKQSVIDKAIDQ